MSNPTGLAISVPATFAVNLHSTTAVVSFPVKDAGGQPITVTFTVATLTAKARSHPAASWVKVSPSSVRLVPGQTENVRLAVQVPAGASGTAYANLVATATGTASGQVVAHAAVASSLTFTAPRAPVVSHGGGFPGTVAGVGLAALLGVVAVVAAARRRRRPPRPRRPAARGRHDARRPTFGEAPQLVVEPQLAAARGRHAASQPLFGHEVPFTIDE